MQSDSSKNPIDNFLYHVISSPNQLNVNGEKAILDARAKCFFLKRLILSSSLTITSSYLRNKF